MIVGLIGIVLSLLLLITLAYRGVSVIIAAPLSALLALVLSGAPLLASYSEIFMPALGAFISNYFPLFLTGAIFGGLMSASGYAKAIALTITRWLGPKRALVATVLTSALLTYGGISVFVVVFVMFPLALELFRAADIPKRLIPATIGLGILTFTMTALPGTPQVQNVIPGRYFGTDTFAAPGLGILATVLIFGLGMLWLEYRTRKLRANGESFADVALLERQPIAVGAGNASAATTISTHGTPPVQRGSGDDQPTGDGVDAMLRPAHPLIAFIPIALVFASNAALSLWILPSLDWSHLADERFGGVTLASRLAIWSVLVAILIAILAILALNARHMRDLGRTVVEGARNAVVPIFSTASEVGYGAVIASLAAFALIRDGILGASGNALVASAVSTTTVAGITGSASGGMTIALNAFGEQLKAMAIEQGISLEAMHRITAIASGGLDTLPHNGAIITLLLVCGMTHRESYKDIAMISVVAPLITLAVLIPLALTVGSF